MAPVLLDVVDHQSHLLGDAHIGEKLVESTISAIQQLVDQVATGIAPARHSSFAWHTGQYGVAGSDSVTVRLNGAVEDIPEVGRRNGGQVADTVGTCTIGLGTGPHSPESSASFYCPSRSRCQ